MSGGCFPIYLLLAGTRKKLWWVRRFHWDAAFLGGFRVAPGSAFALRREPDYRLASREPDAASSSLSRIASAPGEDSSGAQAANSFGRYGPGFTSSTSVSGLFATHACQADRGIWINGDCSS